MDSYRKTLKNISKNAIIGGEIANTLKAYTSRVEKLNGVFEDLGDSYVSIAESFLKDLDIADDMLYQSGFTGRKYLTDVDFNLAGELTKHESMNVFDIPAYLVQKFVAYITKVNNHTSNLKKQIKDLDKLYANKLLSIRIQVRYVDRMYSNRFKYLYENLNDIQTLIVRFDEIVSLDKGNFSTEKIKKLDNLIGKIKYQNDVIKTYEPVLEDGKIKGVSGAIKTGIYKVYKKAKHSYDTHGVVYKVVQYGESAFTVGTAITKIVRSAAMLVTPAWPIALIGIISGGNDLINALNNAVYTHYDQYNEIGKHNALKDYLVENGEIIGEQFFGSKKIGEDIGEWVYTGVDVVSFLNSVDKLAKAFGKWNISATGREYVSKVWGEVWREDLEKEKVSLIEKILHIGPQSQGHFALSAIKKSYDTIKKASSLPKNFIENTL